MIAVALVAAVVLGLQRVQLEQDFRNVEMAVLYDEAAYLGGLQGLDTVEALGELKAAGVTSVFFKERTLGDLVAAGRVQIVGGAPAVTPGPAPAGDAGLPDADWTYIVCDPDIFGDIAPYLEARVGARVLRDGSDGGPAVLATATPPAMLRELGAGFSRAEMDRVRAAGLNVVPQVRSWPGVTGDSIRDVVSALETIPGLSAVIFNDASVPGYPGLTPVLAGELDRLGVPVAEIEFFAQTGLKQAGARMTGGLVMAHTIPAEEMPRYTVARAADRYELAAVERKARLLLVRTFLQPEQPDIWAQNIALFKDLTQRLEARGLDLGPVTPLPAHTPSRALVLLAGLGVVAGGVLLWERLFPGPLGPFLLGLAAVVWIALAWAGGTGILKLTALAGVIIFPTLAVVSQVSPQRAGVGLAAALVVKTTAISLIGAALMVGLLSESGFLLKLDQFAGVKLAHVAPLILVGLVFAFPPGPPGTWRRGVRELMDRPILMKYAAAAVVVAALALVYLLRTGNEAGALVSPLELQFRAFLDQVLAVRPRTKELLLGYPFLMLLFYLGYRDARYMPLLLLGTIGQISVVNTFAHLHTPLLVSLVRAGHGLWLGLLLGLVLVVVWRGGARVYKALVPPDIPVSGWK